MLFFLSASYGWLSVQDSVKDDFRVLLVDGKIAINIGADGLGEGQPASICQMAIIRVDPPIVVDVAGSPRGQEKQEDDKQDNRFHVAPHSVATAI